jgi:hypothetical protein
LIEKMGETAVFCAIACKFCGIRRPAAASGLIPVYFRVVLLRGSAYL